jgi:hypothetical protein
MNPYETIAELIRTALASDNDAARHLREHVPHIANLHDQVADAEGDRTLLESELRAEISDNIEDAMSTLQDGLTELAVDPVIARNIIADVRADLEP